MSFLTKNRLFLAAVQTGVGVPTVLSPATHAILGEAPTPQPNFEQFETNESGGSIDNFASIIGGGYTGFGHKTYLKGSGAAGTPPEFAAMLRGAAMSESIVAADVTGSIAAGATTTSVTLTGATSAVDDAYKGAIVSVVVGATPEERVITAYNGTSKVATVYPAFTAAPATSAAYTIRACVIYRPISTNQEYINGALYDISSTGVNSLLRVVQDAMSTWKATIPVRGPGYFDHSIRGLMPAAPADVAHPTGQVFDLTRPPPLRNSCAYLGGAKIAFSQFEFDYGATVDQKDDPCALFGYGPAAITNRKMTGSINPYQELVATRDSFGDFIAGTARELWVPIGLASGNKASFYIPRVSYTGVNTGDQRGFINETLPFEAAGFDDGLFLTFY
jgi:hypothetical protein